MGRLVRDDRKVTVTQITSRYNQGRAVRYGDICRMDEIKSILFHIMFYRLFHGVAKHIVYGNTFS